MLTSRWAVFAARCRQPHSSRSLWWCWAADEGRSRVETMEGEKGHVWVVQWWLLGAALHMWASLEIYNRFNDLVVVSASVAPGSLCFSTKSKWLLMEGGKCGIICQFCQLAGWMQAAGWNGFPLLVKLSLHRVWTSFSTGCCTMQLQWQAVAPPLTTWKTQHHMMFRNDQQQLARFHYVCTASYIMLLK